jgi:hypothetical protein
VLRNDIEVASHQKKNCCSVAPGQACSGLRPKARCRTRCALKTRDACHIKRHPSHLAGATTEIRVYRTFCSGAGHGCACFPSLPSPHVTRHTLHLLRRDTRQPQVCPATRAKPPNGGQVVQSRCGLLRVRSHAGECFHFAAASKGKGMLQDYPVAARD